MLEERFCGFESEGAGATSDWVGGLVIGRSWWRG
jgi:hypothetical protein